MRRQDIRPGMLCDDDSDNENDNKAQTVHRQDSLPGMLFEELIDDDCDDENGNETQTGQPPGDTV